MDVPLIQRVDRIVFDVRRLKKKIENGEVVTTLFVVAVNNEKVGRKEKCRVEVKKVLNFFQSGGSLNLWGKEMQKGEEIKIFIYDPAPNHLIGSSLVNKRPSSTDKIIELLSKCSSQAA